MDELERNLLWLGAEDYTGLWQVVAEACDNTEPCSVDEARGRARRTIESLLARGFIELFACREPLNNETVEVVPPEEQPTFLDEAASWKTPEEGGKSLRFVTTDRGFAAYQKDVGWT